MHEFQLIRKFLSNLTVNNRNSLNLNDDVFFDKKKKLVVSIDTYNEGIHFINFKRPELVIKKILRSSISDLICKGVNPKYYFISASGNKKSFSKDNLQKISKSLKQEQNKFNIKLCGGDTVVSKKLSFTIVAIGFSSNIIYRNKAILDDDIYITGNLGDSFAGLKILKKKILVKNSYRNYFEKKYFLPELKLKIAKKLFSFANTSIDVSDGLIADLDKLINKQNLSYELEIDKIPISKNLDKLIKSKKMKKVNFISRGDDYEILFTAPKSKSNLIKNISKFTNIKISKIGKICSNLKKPQIIDKKGQKIAINHKGYLHKF